MSAEQLIVEFINLAPPSTLSKLKSTLRTIFRSGQKDKTKPPQQQTQQRPDRLPTPSPTTLTNAPSAASSGSPPDRQKKQPALPPDLNKELPPTHPLATGRHDTPHEAVPRKPSAQPGSRLSLATGDARPIKDDGARGDVSPTDALGTSEDLPQSAAVSALDQDFAPSPAETKAEETSGTKAEESAETGAEQLVETRAEETAPETAPAASRRQPPAPSPETEGAETAANSAPEPRRTTDEQAQDATPAPLEKENTNPAVNGIAAPIPPKSSDPTATADPTAEAPSPPLPPPQKQPEQAAHPYGSVKPPVAAAESVLPPPPVKAVQATFGMSATSGPLEDYFPDGGERF